MKQYYGLLRCRATTNRNDMKATFRKLRELSKYSLTVRLDVFRHVSVSLIQ